MNLIVLKGRLTRDPEIKTTQSGVNYCRFTIAVNRPYKQGEESQADFFDCKAWRGTADFVVKHFHKGKEILLEGSMESNKAQDENGNSRIYWGVNAAKVHFVGGKGNSVGETENPVKSAENGVSGGFVQVEEEELPF